MIAMQSYLDCYANHTLVLGADSVPDSKSKSKQNVYKNIKNNTAHFHQNLPVFVSWKENPQEGQSTNDVTLGWGG